MSHEAWGKFHPQPSQSFCEKRERLGVEAIEKGKDLLYAKVRIYVAMWRGRLTPAQNVSKYID